VGVSLGLYSSVEMFDRLPPGDILAAFKMRPGDHHNDTSLGRDIDGIGGPHSTNSSILKDPTLVQSADVLCGQDRASR